LNSDKQAEGKLEPWRFHPLFNGRKDRKKDIQSQEPVVYSVVNPETLILLAVILDQFHLAGNNPVLYSKDPVNYTKQRIANAVATKF